MAKAICPYEHLAEEDYIDMDISSTSTTTTTTTFMCYSIPSPPHPKEFEFQMCSNTPETEANSTSPADELFYKGKLLPLHLPPRLQMVEKLLRNTQLVDAYEDKIAATPIAELTAQDYDFDCSAAAAVAAAIVRSNQKKSWSKKLKSIKQSSLGLKLKASRDYLKSLFFMTTKSGCSDEPCVAARAKEFAGGYAKAAKLNPFGQIPSKRYLHEDNSATSLLRSIEREKLMEEDFAHRKSFSGAINWTSFTTTTKAPPSSTSSSSCSSSASSSFSFASSNSVCQLQILKRSSSVNSEVENSIQGAIAYCKKSQQMSAGRKSVSDVGSCALSSRQIAAACENQERPGHCRG